MDRGCKTGFHKFLAFSLIILLLFSSYSCFTIKVPATETTETSSDTTSSIFGKLFGNDEEKAAAKYVEGVGDVLLELTYPVGKSPKVFTNGWVFGAYCIVNQGKADQKDLMDQVKWSGSGNFAPAIGGTSMPAFSSAGMNTIKLSINIKNKTISREFHVNAVFPTNYARVTSLAESLSDTHGCPACPHHVKGPVMTGSNTVLIDGLPAARVGDTGVHATCCGPNTFKIIEGDSSVLIDGRAAARIGDATQHCGGMGKLITGSAGTAVVLNNGNFVQGSGVSNLKSANINEFVNLYLKPVFEQMAIEVGLDNTVSARQTIPLNIVASNASATGNATVKIDGKCNDNTITGTFNINCQTVTQSRGKPFNIDLSYDGDFSSPKVETGLVAGETKVTLTFSGVPRSESLIKLLMQIMQDINKVFEVFGSTSTPTPGGPLPSILSNSYTCIVDFQVGTK